MKRSINRKVILYMAGLGIILIVFICLMAAYQFFRFQDSYGVLLGAHEMVLIDAKVTDHEVDDILKKGKKAQGYQELQETCQYVGDNLDVRNIGIYVPDGQDLIAVAGYDREKAFPDPGTRVPFATGDKTSIQEVNDLYDKGVFYKGSMTYKTESKEFTEESRFIKWAVPVTAPQDHQSFILIDTMIPLAMSMYLKNFTPLVAMILLIMGIAMFVFYRLSRSRVINPITSLQEVTGNIVQNLDSGDPYVSAIDTGDELEQLSLSIEDMDRNLRKYIKENNAITTEQARLTTELSIAARIQQGMLPQNFPAFPERQEFDLYASMKPAKLVGGDLYDFFLKDEDHLVLAIGDVSGKGITAAMFMSAATMMLRSRITERGESPASIVAYVNDELMKINPAGLFLTLWIGILTISTGEIVYVDAGHEYPAIRKAEGEFTIEKDVHSIPLGAMEGMSFKEGRLQLQPGDIIYLYTDGVSESNNVAQEMYGLERLTGVLSDTSSASAEDICHKVTEEVEAFSEGKEQFDDTTMLCLKYMGAVQPSYQP